MKVLELSATPTVLAPLVGGESSHHIAVGTARPSWAGFATAMRLAKQVRKDGCEVVVCHNIDEAQAAVSARRLTEADGVDFGIALFAPADYAPLHVPATVSQGVDMWVFGNDAQRRHFEALAAGTVKACRVIAPAPLAAPATERVPHPVAVLTWMGDIIATERLDALVRGVAQCKTPLEVRVCGTGKPRWVMPIVKRARLDTAHTFVWLGEDYDIAGELAHADYGVATMPYPCPADIAMRGGGTIIIDTDDIAAFANRVDALNSDPDARAAQSSQTKQLYNEKYSTHIYTRDIIDMLYAMR